MNDVAARQPLSERAPRARTDRKAEILKAAANVIATSGIRASMEQIADECGLLSGSLYHHFESKEEIFIELVLDYQEELDTIAMRALEKRRFDTRGAEERIVSLATAVAECGIRNRAALLLTRLEPPVGSTPELAELASRTSGPIDAALQTVLQDALSSGYLRHTVDVEALAHRISGSMLGIGIGVHHRGRRPERISTVQCRMMLRGLAVSDPGETPLARCRAREAADLAIRSWSETPRLGSDERAKHVLAVARSEFARRGYDLTTIRDIAAAAAMSTGAIRRVSGSKGNLMMMIMGAYAENVTNGWRSILTSPSTSVEKLDALLWFDTNVVHEFPEEQRIQSMGLQVAPPTSPNLMATFPTQLRLLKAFLAEGSDTRQLQVGGGPKDIAARCLFRLVWPSHSMTETVGTQGTHLFEREMLVRGAALRF